MTQKNSPKVIATAFLSASIARSATNDEEETAGIRGEDPIRAEMTQDHRGGSRTDDSTEVKLQPSQSDCRRQFVVRHHFRDKRTPGRSAKGEANPDQKD